jgi:hypothetical protein
MFVTRGGVTRVLQGISFYWVLRGAGTKRSFVYIVLYKLLNCTKQLYQDG